MRSKEEKISARAAHWAELAKYTRQKLTRSRHGGFQTVYNLISEEYSVHEQIIRRVVAAHRFLEKLSEHYPELSKKLETVPFAAVEQIDRWFSHDIQGAIAGAEDYLSGDESVRSLLEKESNARPQQSLLDLPQPKLKKWFEGIISKNLGENYRLITAPELLKTSSVKFFFEPLVSSNRQNSVAVIRVAAYEFPTNYKRQIVLTMLEALGLKTLRYNIIIAVIGTDNIEPYMDFLYQTNQSCDDIKVLSIPEINTEVSEIKFER